MWGWVQVEQGGKSLLPLGYRELATLPICWDRQECGSGQEAHPVGTAELGGKVGQWGLSRQGLSMAMTVISWAASLQPHHLLVFARHGLDRVGGCPVPPPMPLPPLLLGGLAQWPWNSDALSVFACLRLP